MKMTDIASRQAEPPEILAIFRAEYDYAVALDPEAEAGYDITFEISVKDWRNACDLVRARQLGRALNEQFCIEASDAEWRALLEPSGRRTLRDVCEFIAGRAHLPVVRPMPILGATSIAAAAFMTLRSRLEQRGIPVAALRPSTSLKSYLEDHLTEVLLEVLMVSPGALPPPTITPDKSERFFLSLSLLGFGGFILSLLLRVVAQAATILGWLNVPAAVVLGLSACLIPVGLVGAGIVRRRRPPSVEWNGLRTFRELATAMVPRART